MCTVGRRRCEVDGCGGSWPRTQLRGGPAGTSGIALMYSGCRALSRPPHHNQEDEESQPIRNCPQVPEQRDSRQSTKSQLPGKSTQHRLLWLPRPPQRNHISQG